MTFETALNSVLKSWSFTWDDVPDILPSGSGRCLDVGCGDGRHRAKVENAGWSWLGLDIDASRGGATVVGDASHLPLVDESLELVLLWQVLEHLPQPWAVLSDANRVLKPGGRLVGSVSCLEPYHDIASYYGFSHRALNRALADSGFTEVIIQPGLNAFSLIARSWFRHLLGSGRGEQVALVLVRVSFVPLLWIYLLLRWAWNLVRRGMIGPDYGETLHWLSQDAPLEFAGQIQFVARKGTTAM